MSCAAFAQSNSVFVARRGWHVDIGFAVGDLAPPLAVIAGEFPGARYVFLGFGDRRYLLTRHRHVSVMLSALIPDAGLILGTGLRAAPAAAFGGSQVIVLRLPRDAALRAQAFVWNALTEDQQSRLRLRDTAGRGPVGLPGPYQGSSFFDSRARYSAFHTCNTWAAEALAQTGIPVPSGRIIFAGQLWRRLEQIRQPPAAVGLAPRRTPQ